MGLRERSLWTTHSAEPAVHPIKRNGSAHVPAGTSRRAQRLNAMRNRSGRCAEGPVEERAGLEHRMHRDRQFACNRNGGAPATRSRDYPMWMAPALGVAAPKWCCHAARAWSYHAGDHDRRPRPQVHAIGSTGGVVVRRSLRRAQVIPFFSKLPPCLIGMEACGTSHHWARELVALGHEVRLMPPAYVKPTREAGQD